MAEAENERMHLLYVCALLFGNPCDLIYRPQYIHDGQTTIDILPGSHTGSPGSLFQSFLPRLHGRTSIGPPIRWLLGGGSLSDIHVMPGGDG
jgi:hypothetical protein